MGYFDPEVSSAWDDGKIRQVMASSINERVQVKKICIIEQLAHSSQKDFSSDSLIRSLFRLARPTERFECPV